MKVLGIVCEYNPFHNGHKFHIEEAKAKTGADVCLCLMSGNFVQRGEVACQDKFTRALWAVNNGVDVVMELPSIFATSNAGDFARGAIGILEGLSCDFIGFGAESSEDKLTLLRHFVQKHENEIGKTITTLAKEGLSYPVAREKAILSLAKEADNQNAAEGNKQLAGVFQELLKDNPNNVLALEYLLNMKNATPIIVKRNNEFASSTIIRELANGHKDYSKNVPRAVQNLEFVEQTELYEQIVSKVLTLSQEEIDRINSADQGFGSKLKREVRNCKTYDELVDMMCSKRYTKTRIKRFFTQLIIRINRDDVLGQNPKYGRVLAFNKKGGELLRQLNDRDEAKDFPIITNIDRDFKKKYSEDVANSLEIDIRATDYYNLLMGRDLYQESDFVKTVQKI